ncbi:hypothetical protein [Iningainema tapete]|uniref:Uncharacterized protein n=1 Tax=Iningainema tapete BLCC-T55 TaxID=2748662 RepID=A0A8J6XXJ7_9CYAN|nr:hypothetical protein [Iningainema tapete]MBD2778282.1 hypothetical protein [Iningainema tapete BLCC-T55]
MAEQKKNQSNLIAFTGSFISQLLFGLFLTIVFLVSGQEASVSLFLGVVGALALGMIVSASKNRPQSPQAPSEGIDAGLRYWLLFLIGFTFVGYKAPMSILLGAIAGLGGGWITAWWETRGESRTQLPNDALAVSDEEVPADAKRSKRRRRKPTRRFRRVPGVGIFRFWGR